MPELQPGVAQEAEGQVRVATDASTAAMERATELVEVRRAHVGELGALNVPQTGSTGFSSGAYPGRDSMVSHLR